jgi:hypothetical protein
VLGPGLSCGRCLRRTDRACRPGGLFSDAPREAREAIVRNGLPESGASDVHSTAGPNAGIAVKRSHPDEDDLGILRVLREQGGAAGATECLVVAIAGVPAAYIVLTAHNSKSSWFCPRGWGCCCSGSSLTALAVAVHGTQERGADLEAHRTTIATTSERQRDAA